MSLVKEPPYGKHRDYPVFRNLKLFTLKLTKEYHSWMKDIRNYEMYDEEEKYDISFINWARNFLSISMTLLSFILITSFTALFAFDCFKKYYHACCLQEEKSYPALLVCIAFPFVILPILIMPVFTAIYLFYLFY